MNSSKLSFEKIRYAGIPIGKFFTTFISISEDSILYLEKIRLLTKKEGIAVFDAHRWTLDILATAVILSKCFSVKKIIFPVINSK